MASKVLDSFAEHPFDNAWGLRVGLHGYDLRFKTWKSTYDVVAFL